MNQLFPSGAADSSTCSSSGFELIRFALPTSVTESIKKQVPCTRGDGAVDGGGKRRSTKRARSQLPGEEHPSGSANLPPMTRRSLTPRDGQALQSFIEYGDQPFRPSVLLRQRVLTGTVSASLLLASTPGLFVGDRSMGTHSSYTCDRWHMLALRHALSVLCRVAALDVSAHFLYGFDTRRDGAQPPVAADTVNGPPRSIMEMYCRVQALELELADAYAQMQGPLPRQEPLALPTHPPSSGQQPAVTAIESRTEVCVDQLELALLQLFLNPRFIGRVPFSYVSQMMKGLHTVFIQESWPCRLLYAVSPDASFQAAVQEEREKNPAATFTAGLLGYGEEGDTLADRVGAGTTSILLRVMLCVRDADCYGILVPGESVSISRVAAQQSIRRNLAVSLDARGPLSLDSASFLEQMAQTWAGDYARLGLRRAMLDMQGVFYRLLSDNMHAVESEIPSSRHGAVHAPSTERSLKVTPVQHVRRSIGELWNVWKESLLHHYAALLSQVWSSRGQGTGLSVESLWEASNAFDSFFSTCEAGTSHEGVERENLSPFQASALRVLEKLQHIDAKKWFTVPVFDLVNVDFGSIALWIRSDTFKSKSKRGVFDALRRVLEEMVDRCVIRYGPSHMFSVCITNVRQHFIDAARSEGLL